MSEDLRDGQGQVVDTVDAVPPGESVVTIGFFDGVHRGHRSIIGRAVEVARASQQRAVAVTFDRHPAEVLAPGSQPRYLMSLERRCRTLLDQGLDLVLVVPFTLEFSHESPETFVDELLVDVLSARTVIVGVNFRFGHGAAGDITTLQELGPARGFEAEAVGLLEEDGDPISSTSIRQALERGDVGWAAQALGRPHWLDGTVVRGEGRGRTIGIPTANVEVDARALVPAGGVYACWVQVDGSGPRLPAVTNIGTRPTFGGRDVTVEAHVLDADLDLYGRHLAIGFVERLREERRFSGPDELVEQINTDIADGRRRLDAQEATR